MIDWAGQFAGSGTIQCLALLSIVALAVFLDRLFVVARLRGRFGRATTVAEFDALPFAVRRLENGLFALGSIGALAPFIGLYGTVVGVIRAFADIGREGRAGFAVVSAGISEALVATAVGLLVAIVAVLFHNIALARIRALEIEGDERRATLAGGERAS
jgi:biopolymer transport protein ExbB